MAYIDKKVYLVYNFNEKINLLKDIGGFMNKIKKQIIILQLMSLIIGGYGCEMKKEKVKQEPRRVIEQEENQMADRKQAVRNAWIKEQSLIRQGKSTYDWTIEQQEIILHQDYNNDKRLPQVFDENGHRFHGHHMVSVSADDSLAGNSDNIQFLSAF